MHTITQCAQLLAEVAGAWAYSARLYAGSAFECNLGIPSQPSTATCMVNLLASVKNLRLICYVVPRVSRGCVLIVVGCRRSQNGVEDGPIHSRVPGR